MEKKKKKKRNLEPNGRNKTGSYPSRGEMRGEVLPKSIYKKKQQKREIELSAKGNNPEKNSNQKIPLAQSSWEGVKTRGGRFAMKWRPEVKRS